MNFKKIFLWLVIGVVYLTVWTPIAYSAVNLWTDMIFGDIIRNSQFFLYWSYSFYVLIMGFLIFIPPLIFYLNFQCDKENNNISVNIHKS